MVSVLEQTVSSDQHYGVAKIIRKPPPSYCWYDIWKHQELISIIPKHMSEIVSKLWVDGKWNKQNNRVALIIYYGTKLSYIKIYRLKQDGKLQEIQFDWPDVVQTFKGKKGINILAQGQLDAMENQIDNWLDTNVVRLISGMAVISNGYIKRYSVSLNLRIKDNIGVIEHLVCEATNWQAESKE
jgi:hypothetical protein